MSIAGGVRRAVGGFLRYVQYRDQHIEADAARGVDAYVRYVAHRDRTSPAGRVFDRDGSLTDADRRRFVDFVARSTQSLEPKWVIGKDRKQIDRQRAVYTFILSPEEWQGLDLRRIARVAMRQLEDDAGPSGIGPWFAAEHRNTAHHHVHIVLAARREVAPGRFSTFIVTRARLQRMKDAIALEIDCQREREIDGTTALAHAPLGSGRPQAPAALRPARASQRRHWLPPRRAPSRKRVRKARGKHRVRAAFGTLFHLRAVALRYRDRMESELERESARAEREGWVL